MKDIIISNTSPLIWLGKINALHLLSSLFQNCTVMVPQEVLDEIKDDRTKTAIQTLVDKKDINVLPPSLDEHRNEVHSIAREIAMMAVRPKARDPTQHHAESLVIRLGQLKNAAFLLLDEKMARTLAKQRGLRCVSHFDIIRRCVEKDIISKTEGIKLIKGFIEKHHPEKEKLKAFIEKWSI